jgi:hypothetical protein
MLRFEFESKIFPWFYAIPFVSWCVGDRCDMVGSDEDLGRSRRPGVEDRGWSTTGQVLGDRTIERLGDAVCGLHRAHGDEECEFLG